MTPVPASCGCCALLLLITVCFAQSPAVFLFSPAFIQRILTFFFFYQAFVGLLSFIVSS
jgi:hypothetical protein